MPKNKKVESSSSSDDSSSSEDVKQTKQQQQQQQKGKAASAPAKKEDKKPAKKQESSDDSDSSSEEKPVTKKAVTPAKKVEAKKPAKKESSSEDSSSEEAPKKKKVEEKKKPGKKEKSSSDSDSDSDNDSDEEAKPLQNDKKRKADEEAGEEKPASKKAKTESGPVTTATEQNGENNRLFLGNLSFKIDDDQIRAFFKDVGELTDIHWVTDKQTGKFYGTGFIAFATAAEAKAAVAKNGEDVLGRPIRIDFAQSRNERTPNKGGERPQRTPRDGGQREQRAPTPKPDGCTTVFLGNLSFQIDENAVRSHFGDCGDISSIRWVERDGQFKGCGFLEFSSSDATDKAVALNGSDLLGRPVRVDFSAPKPPRQ